MRHWNSSAAGIAALGLLGLVAAACSSGTAATGSDQHGSSSKPAAVGSAGPAAISTSTASGIEGKFLVGSHGRALYMFEADENGKSSCSGACAQSWPHDTATGAPAAGSGVKPALLGTVKRPDGTKQLTYNGHPLYYFSGDTGSSTAHGQGVKAFGSDWYVMSPGGSKIDTD